MIDIAICDDDIILTSVLEKNLTLLSKDKSLDVNIDIFYDGATLLQHITNGHIYDIISVSYTHLTLPTKLEV